MDGALDPSGTMLRFRGTLYLELTYEILCFLYGRFSAVVKSVNPFEECALVVWTLDLKLESDEGLCAVR